MSNPAQVKAIVYAAALFVVGGVCGVMLAPRLFPPPPPDQPLKVGRTNEIAQRIQTKLEPRLNLTPDQMAKAGPLISATSLKLEEAHLHCLDQIEQAIHDLHQSLRPMLTEQQSSILKDLDQERAVSMKQKYNYPPAATNQTDH